MNIDHIFGIRITVVIATIPQLGVLWPKAQALLISFRLSEGETLPKSHVRDLQVRSEIFLLKDETGQINNLTSKYIM